MTMKPINEITACVVDNGLYIPLARHLAKTYKRVLYHTHWETGFPTVNDCIIGDGFPDIERCDDIWKVKGDVDLWIFPDIYRSGLQKELVSQGRLVWGSRTGDSIEIKREMFHRLLEETGLQVPKFVVKVGLTELREFLKDKEDKYIKISKFRGSLETSKFRNYDLDKSLLDEWELEFGPSGELIRFLVFDKIETELELGCDTFCIDGKFPDLMLNAFEAKDEGYLGTVTEREDMPQSIQDVLTAFGPVMGEHGYRNAFSMEIRHVSDDEWYFIDGCQRFPMPGTASQFTIWGNYAEIVYEGAQGRVMRPEPTAKFVSECVLTIKSDPWAWGKVRFEGEIADYCHLSNCCMIDGAICWPPDEHHGNEIGWLVATGDTIEELVETMKERVEMLPDGVTCKMTALMDLIQEVHTAHENEIPFTGQEVPEPTIAVEQ